MTPGPKKKNFNRHGGEKETGNPTEDKKSGKVKFESQSENTKSSPATSANYNIDSNYPDKKYSKRTITSNWNKYDEPVHDPHADTMRGKDFEVLLSYSGGSASQLQLQDEKDWEDIGGNDKVIEFNLQELCLVVKTIPLHKRINLPLDVFDDSQITQFVSEAEFWKKSFKSKVEWPVSKEVEPKLTDSSLDFIESYESESICNDVPKSFALEKKTESIIESLTNCLSLKDTIQKPDEVVEFNKKEDVSVDDLDFLLSLGASSKNTLLDSKTSEKTKTNVDDWLNSILDDE